MRAPETLRQVICACKRVCPHALDVVTNCDITMKNVAVAFLVVLGMLFRQEIVVLLLLTSNTLCFPPGTLGVKFNRQICLRSLPHEPVGGQALGSASLLKLQKYKSAKCLCP